MWEDMVLYWAWRGKEPCNTSPSTTKRLVYATIEYPSDQHKKLAKGMLICYGVYDDGKFTELHTDEINWHKKQGATITWEK
jgi:hypothetical protein